MSISPITFIDTEGKEIRLTDLMSIAPTPQEVTDVMSRVVSVTASAAGQAEFGAIKPFYSFTATVAPGDNPMLQAVIMYKVASDMIEVEIAAYSKKHAAGGPIDNGEYVKPRPVAKAAAPAADTRSAAQKAADDMPRPPAPIATVEMSNGWTLASRAAPGEKVVWPEKIVLISPTDKEQYKVTTESGNFKPERAIWFNVLTDKEREWMDASMLPSKPADEVWAIFKNGKPFGSEGKTYKDCIGLVRNPGADAITKRMAERK